MMEVLFDNEPTAKDIKTFHNGLLEFNSGFVKNDFEKHFIVLKSPTGDVVGGIEIETYWGHSYIHNLWVHENYRKNGLATELLNRAEKIALSKGSSAVGVSTMSFQAEKFYEKNGFVCVGKFENYVDGHYCLFLSKDLEISIDENDKKPMN